MIFFKNIVPCIKKIFLPSVSNKVLINHVIRTPELTSAEVCELRYGVTLRLTVSLTTSVQTKVAMTCAS